MFKSLDEGEQKIVVDAMEEKIYSAVIFIFIFYSFLQNIKFFKNITITIYYHYFFIKKKESKSNPPR